MYLGNNKLQLKNQPDGVDIQQASSSRGSFQIVLHSDAARVDPGQREKWSLPAASKNANPSKAKAAGKQRCTVLASLPTIPFVIVEPQGMLAPFSERRRTNRRADTVMSVSCRTRAVNSFLATERRRR